MVFTTDAREQAVNELETSDASLQNIWGVGMIQVSVKDWKASFLKEYLESMPKVEELFMSQLSYRETKMPEVVGAILRDVIR